MTADTKSRGGLIPSRSLPISKRRKNDEERPLILSALRGGLIGMGVAMAMGLILITASAAIAYANPDPAAFVPALSLVSLLLSMFACGFVTSKVVKEAPLTCGVVSGGMTTLLTIVLSLILRGIPSVGYGFWQGMTLHTAAVAFSVLGAFAGNIKIAPRRKKRRFGR